MKPNTKEDQGFRDYCRNLTDSQCLAVLEKEDEGRKRDSDREGDYLAALLECTARGLL